jgi:hypothetical protein
MDGVRGKEKLVLKLILEIGWVHELGYWFLPADGAETVRIIVG